MDRLRQEIVEEIKNDPILFGKVAKALYVKPISMWYLLNGNNIKLTREPVLQILRKHLGKNDGELLEQVQEKQTA